MPPSATAESLGICSRCHRQMRAPSGATGLPLLSEAEHVGDPWTGRGCTGEMVVPSPVALDETRIAEVHDLLRYESSVSFQSARAAESVKALHAAVRAVYLLHHPIDVPTGGGDYMTNCAACGEDMDGERPCTTLRALGLTARPA